VSRVAGDKQWLGFQYRYHKKDGSYPVAVRVLELLFKDLTGSTAHD
jgi:hypothetical protein